jgi:hypothetical protein
VQVVSAETDLDFLDRFEVVVDSDAEPADLDEALAAFLLEIVSKRHSAGTPAAELSITFTGDERIFCDDDSFSTS